MAKLEKCPFCGKEPQLYWGRITGDCWAYIVCDCGAKTRNFHGESDKEASKKAADMWNTRVNGSETEETSDNAPLRTCEVLGEDYDELLEYWETELSCGHVFNGMAKYVNYCPNCGAKVVEK